VVIDLDDEQADTRVLDEDELRGIAELAVATERLNGCPQDTEWAMSGGKTYLVWARPITTLKHTAAPSSEKHAVLARGLAAAPGRASGKVQVLQTPEEGNRLVEGAILVAQMTNPDWLPTIHRAAPSSPIRRDDLSRRDCGPRVGRALRRRYPHSDQGPARRHDGYRRRNPRARPVGRRGRGRADGVGRRAHWTGRTDGRDHRHQDLRQHGNAGICGNRCGTTG
jgi:Pyruvate phosphate dikinase, AMP/ATP-binding domain